MLYCMTLTYLLWQDDAHGRQLVQYFDPSLTRPADERSYGQNCELTLHNLYNGLDLFAFAHFIGWFGKALILRDFWACTILSVMFEVRGSVCMQSLFRVTIFPASTPCPKHPSMLMEEQHATDHRTFTQSSVTQFSRCEGSCSSLTCVELSSRGFRLLMGGCSSPLDLTCRLDASPECWWDRWILYVSGAMIHATVACSYLTNLVSMGKPASTGTCAFATWAGPSSVYSRVITSTSL